MLNRVQSKAGLAVIYIAPRNLDQIGACANFSRVLLKDLAICKLGVIWTLRHRKGSAYEKNRLYLYSEQRAHAWPS